MTPERRAVIRREAQTMLNSPGSSLWPARAIELLDEVERLTAEAEKDYVAVGELIDERDAREALLDEFAGAVAPISVIGEHSSGNDPWLNALDLVTSHDEVEKLRAEVERLTAALTAVDQDAQEARMERDEAKAKAAMIAQERDYVVNQRDELKDERDALSAQLTTDAEYTELLQQERDHLKNLIDGGSR